jgi:hypothetical protein
LNAYWQDRKHYPRVKPPKATTFREFYICLP